MRLSIAAICLGFSSSIVLAQAPATTPPAAQAPAATPATDAAVTPPAAPAAKTPAEAAARMDELFDKRGDPALDKEHDTLAAEMAKAHPGDYEMIWRAARWKVWKADTAPNDKAKQGFAKEAWALGDAARKLKPADARGHYYASAGVGLYAQGIGILTALGEGIEGKFNERLDTAIKIDPFLDRGGPLVSKGRYWFELPWPMRNLGKSKEALEKVIAKHPENLRAHAYLAETLLSDGKAKEAKAAIDKALNGDASYDPAETRRVKAMAQKINAEIQKKL